MKILLKAILLAIIIGAILAGGISLFNGGTRSSGASSDKETVQESTGDNNSISVRDVRGDDAE